MNRLAPVTMVVLALVSSHGLAQPAQPADTAPAADGLIHLPGLTVNRELRTIDLDATVVLREGDWLELLACTPDSREHESILTVDALPSKIHLAMVMLGLEPGQPLKSELVNGEWVATPPRGPEVGVDLVLAQPDGTVQVTPANQWIINRKTGEVMDSGPWLFAGSRFQAFEGRDYYLADHNGTVISLVSFGDDLLARPSLVTNENDGQMWGANTQAIPPVGTRVVVRLKLPPADGAPRQEAGQ